MTRMNYEINSPEIKAKIEIDSTLPDRGESHLYTQLLTEMIEESPTNFWQHDKKELQPQEFHGLVLAALIRSYAVDWPHDPLPAHEMLTFLVQDVKEYLQEIVPHFDDDDEGE